MAWKCEKCGKYMIGFAETKFYAVDKNGKIKSELEKESSYICLNCNTESNNIKEIAKREEE